MNEKIVVIYHRADFDGIFCREIARKFLPNSVLIGWDYGDPVPTPDIVSSDDRLYMLDISIEGLMGHPKLIWIDHHKSAMEKYKNIHGLQIDGVAACRLAWAWFNAYDDERDLGPMLFPSKESFIERQVHEPLAIRLAGEYDIWDKRDPRAELFQHGLRGAERDFPALLEISQEAVDYVAQILEEGRAIQYSKAEENKCIALSFSFTIQFEGFCLLACNAARYNSHLFSAALKPEHDGCLGFNWDGKIKSWRVSLYSDKPNIDLSVVAVKYGGGGHRGACGFRCKTLPFEL
jgi:oligoribonuclease NrnB/cAMP/cGMP phosphodiesterase (DHH superfamily)